MPHRWSRTGARAVMAALVFPLGLLSLIATLVSCGGDDSDELHALQTQLALPSSTPTIDPKLAIRQQVARNIVEVQLLARNVSFGFDQMLASMSRQSSPNMGDAQWDSFWNSGQRSCDRFNEKFDTYLVEFDLWPPEYKAVQRELATICFDLAGMRQFHTLYPASLQTAVRPLAAAVGALRDRSLAQVERAVAERQ